jgi:hypothetical protein
MPSTYLQDIAAWFTLLQIADAPNGVLTGWGLSLGQQPNTPDQCVTIYETGGMPPDIKRTGSLEKQYDRIGLQVRVRGPLQQDYMTPRNKIQDVFKALHENEPPRSLTQKRIVACYAVNSGALPMGLDKKDRMEFVWNFKIIRERE